MRVFIALALFAAGCQESEPSPYTAGELGRVHFEYLNGVSLLIPGCSIACGLDWPMMVGTLETVMLEGWSRMPAVIASSSDPGVFTVVAQRAQCACVGGSGSQEECSQEQEAACVATGRTLLRAYSFDVKAITPGEAELVLSASDGSIFDQTRLGVGAPARLFVLRRLREPGSLGRTYNAMVESIEIERYGDSGNNGGFESEAPVWIHAQDDHGRSLMNSYGVESHVADEQVVGRNPFGDPSANPSRLDLLPRAVGATELTVGTGNLSLTVPVIVR